MERINSMENLKIQLDNLLKKTLSESEVPGLALAVTTAEDMIYVSAFGVRNIVTKDPLRVEHIFHLASVSKPFAATAILQLAEQGKLDLSQKLVSILPYFKLADERYADITLYQILNHTSGMPDEEDYEWYKPQYDEGAAERYVRSQVSRKLLTAPGEKFAYSNIAFDILGDVVAKVSGKNFEDYVTQNILAPLEMNESSFLFQTIKKDLLVSPHSWDQKPVVSEHYPYNRRHAPSSTLNSNVLEITHWIQANLNRGLYKGTRILSEKTHKQSWEASAYVDEYRKMGLSWFLETYKGTKRVSHDGWDIGFRSHLSMIPDRKLGFIITSNGNFDEAPLPTPDTMDILADKVLDILWVALT